MAGPDTNNTETLPYPIWGFGPPSPEPDTKKLDALLASLNGSAERFQMLWFSFLGLTLYLAIAALATTHRNLLLGEAQTLPILNIKVELLPFYVIAPLLYLVFHFYLLMMLALLARTAAEFDKQLRTTLPGESERERYRAQVGNALFLQLLVGMKGERTGFNAFLLGLIALITIVLAPLATLVLMQMMFLPYHHLRITWWHRGIVVADFALIVVMTYRCFFPRGFAKAPLVVGALARKPRWATAMAFCILLAVTLAPIVDWLSFRQGRWAGEPTASSAREWQQWMAGEGPPFPEVNPDYAATEGGVVFGLFPNRLQLNNETVVGETKLEETKKEIASRGGDFVPTKVFDGRDLQAADLSGADLRGLSLIGAALQGASLYTTRLDGSDLQGALLQSADLTSARLQGTDLSRAQLQGTDLDGALLQGADLSSAQLQGATLRGAYLADSEFSETFVFRVDHTEANMSSIAKLSAYELILRRVLPTSAFLRTSETAKANVPIPSISSVLTDKVWYDTSLDSIEPLSVAIIEGWGQAATQLVQGSRKEAITRRFERLRESLKEGAQSETKETSWWKDMQGRALVFDPDGAQHRRRLAGFVGDLACASESAPYIARGLIKSGRVESLGDQVPAFRARMENGRKKPEVCKGVAGFTEDDWRQLEEIKPAEAAPADP